MMKTLRGAIPFASTFLRIALLSIALTYSGLLMAQSLEVIQLKFRTANEVIPVLQPMLESGGVLTGQDYQLFVRTSSPNLQQLKQAIAQLDREPRNLLVSVRQGTRNEMTKQSADASVQARAQNQNGTWRTGANAN